MPLHTLLPIRIFFMLLCLAGGWLMGLASADSKALIELYLGGAVGIGAVTLLIDILLKGFSLRGLTALAFGLAMGWLVSYLIASSPLFEHGDPQAIFLARLVLFAVVTYLAAVIALRGGDEFNLVIPYVRFVPQDSTSVARVVVDTSVLIDGRIVGLFESGFMTAELLIAQFVLEELHRIADAQDPQRQACGRRGLETLRRLREIPGLEIKTYESSIDSPKDVNAKLIFLAQSLNAKLFTTDFNLAQLAQFQGIQWLNIHALMRTLSEEVFVGDVVEVDLVKAGKETGQAVGYLADGSMVVVSDGAAKIGSIASVEVVSILPSAGGRMVFAKAVGAFPPSAGVKTHSDA